MRKVLFVILPFVLTITVQGQNLQTVTTSGNTTDRAMFINGAGNYQVGNYNGLMLSYLNGSGIVEGVNPGTATFVPLWLKGSSIQTNSKLFINNATDDGTSALVVNGGARSKWLNIGDATGAGIFAHLHLAVNTSSDANITIENSNTTTPSPSTLAILQHDGSHIRGRGFLLTVKSNGDLTFLKRKNNTDQEGSLVIQNETGYIGLGTINPTARLAVNGDIKTTRIKVTQSAADWPDYVFSKNYVLPSLNEVENYVTVNRHLPGLPSAKEVEVNGLDLGEMNKQLLQKIEELTLYLLEEHKKNAELEGKVKVLSNRLDDLEKR